jgi:hypothetical protein
MQCHLLYSSAKAREKSSGVVARAPAVRHLGGTVVAARSRRIKIMGFC